MVLVLRPLPVERSQLGCSVDAAGQLGVDVDVDCSAVVGVLFQVRGDAGEGDGGAGQPAYALLLGMTRVSWRSRIITGRGRWACAFRREKRRERRGEEDREREGKGREVSW